LFSKFTKNQVLNLSTTNFAYIVFELPVSLDNVFFGSCSYLLSRKEEKNKNDKPQYAIVAFDIHLIDAGKIGLNFVV
jgi:hypothetical protein